MLKHSTASVLGCLLVLLLISGCTSMPKQIQVSAEPVKKPDLVLPSADELNLRSVEWYIITEENWEEQYNKLKETGRSLAFFSITDKGYQDLGLNISDLRAYIEQQDAIIGAYDAYYRETEKAFDETNERIQEEFDRQIEEKEKSFWNKITN